MTFKRCLILIPALPLVAVALAAEFIADVCGNAASSLAKWADKEAS